MTDQIIIGEESPLYQVTERLLQTTLGAVQLARVEYLEKTKNESNRKLEETKEKIKQKKQDKYSAEQQGQEVQLSRDGQLFGFKTTQHLKDLKTGIGIVVDKKEPGSKDPTKKDIGGLKAIAKKTKESQEELTEQIKEDSKDNKDTWKSRLKEAGVDAKRRYDESGNLSNLTESLVADSRLLLGRFQILTTLPFFNTVKILLSVIAKQGLRLLVFLSKTLWGGLSAWLMKLTLFQKMRLLWDRRKFNKKGGDYRTKAGRDIRAREKKLGITKKKPGDKDAARKQSRMMASINKVVQSISKYFKRALKIIKPIGKIVLIGLAIGGALYLLYKGWQKIAAWFSKIGGIIKDAFVDALYGPKALQESKESGLLNKRGIGRLSKVDKSKISDATDEQLKAVVTEEGDDLSKDDLAAVVNELKTRNIDTDKLFLDAGQRNLMQEINKSNKLNNQPKIIETDRKIQELKNQQILKENILKEQGIASNNIQQNNTTINKQIRGRENTTIYPIDPVTQPSIAFS